MIEHTIIDFNEKPYTNIPVWKDGVTKYAFLTETDTLTDFFTKGMHRHYPRVDISSMNEAAYDLLGKELDVWEGYNVKDTTKLNETKFDDVFLHITNLTALEEENDGSKCPYQRPVLFLKVNLYTKDASIVVLSADYDINTLAPEELVDIEDLREDYRGSADYFEDYVRSAAIEALKEEHQYIQLENLDVAEVNVKILSELILTPDMKENLLKSLYKNTEKETIQELNLPHQGTYKDLVKALRINAINDAEKGYLHRLFERKGADASYLINEMKDIIIKEDMIMNRNGFVLSRNEKGQYLVTGAFVGTIGELAAEIDSLNKEAQFLSMKETQHSNIVTEISKDDVDCVVTKHNNYYEIGIELPMDFVDVKDVDEVKLCSLLKLDGFPISVDRYAPSEYGKLAGKPAVFVVTGKSDVQSAIEMANECVEKVANFDFADYCITHNGYNDLVKDDVEFNFLQMENFNIDTDEFEAAKNEDPGIEDDLPFGDDREEDGDEPQQ